MGITKIRKDTLKLKGSPLSGRFGSSRPENPQPFFRQPDPPMVGGPSFPVDRKYSFGRETGLRLLPYTIQDSYDRNLIDMEFSSVVMENDFLRAEFIPALGGRLWSLFDKQQNRDIVDRNPVFRPTNLAIRGAWFSGGIEWNIGRFGHTVHTCSPIFAGFLEADGLTVLRLWEFERQTRLFWRIEFTLPEDSAALFAYARVENTDTMAKPLYWWTNTSIPQTPLVRVFSASDEVIYIVPGGKVRTMDLGRLPNIQVLPGRDASYPSQFDSANEYFFQNDKICKDQVCGKNSLPWEAAVYEDGYAFGEMSTSPLIYRKMFCWGTGRGCRHWQDFLSLPGQEYLEVQAGLAPTQVHTADISGGETVDWVQVFTSFEADPEIARQKDYPTAKAYVSGLLSRHISPIALQSALEQGRKRADVKTDIVSLGSGWGALENKLRNGSVPQGLSFPDESIGSAETPWLELLNNGALPPRPPEKGPGMFVIDEAWEALLAASPVSDNDWLSPYHLGVISLERGDTEKAVAFWEESIKRLENPWAYRNLARAAIQKGNTMRALDYYRRALVLPGGRDRSFVEEFIPLLLAEGKDDEAEKELDAYMHQAGSLEALSLPLLDAAARIALEKGNDLLLERIFSFEPPHIREGSGVFVDLWIEWEIRKLGGKGVSRDEAEKRIRTALTEGSLIPPIEIDFRTYISNPGNP